MASAARSRPDHVNIRAVDDVGDFELLRQWVDGDRRAGDRLVKRYYLEITKFFANAVGDQERRELTQETFSRLSGAVSRFEQRSSFRSFLFGIAHNVLNEFLRKQYRNREDADEFDPGLHTIADAGQVSPSRLVSELVRREVLIQCLRELPVEAKQMMELYYWHGLTADELSVTYGIPAATVRTRLFNLKKKLREMVACRAPSLASIAVEQQLDVLRRLLGFGPAQMDE